MGVDLHVEAGELLKRWHKPGGRPERPYDAWIKWSCGALPPLASGKAEPREIVHDYPTEPAPRPEDVWPELRRAIH